MSLRLLFLRTRIQPLSHGTPSFSPRLLRHSSQQSQPILKALHQVVRQSLRRAATAAPTPKPPSPSARKYAYPENILIYHAGTGRTTFIACLKLTTIFVFVFFGLVVTPAYLESDHHPLWHAGGVFACGLIPLLTVAYTTTPFVTGVHLLRPPVFARQSRLQLERWARGGGITPDTRLRVTTMSFIGKPRVSEVGVGNLVPVRKRLGLVNYVRRDEREENERRKWWMFRAVGGFGIAPGGGKWKAGKGALATGWVWEEVERVVQRQDGERKAVLGR